MQPVSTRLDDVSEQLQRISEDAKTRHEHLVDLMLQLNGDTAEAAQLRHDHAIRLAHELNRDTAEAAQMRHEFLCGLLGYPPQVVDDDLLTSGLVSAEAIERLRASEAGR